MKRRNIIFAEDFDVLKKQNSILRKALREILKSHRIYDVREYAKEALAKSKKTITLN